MKVTEFVRETRSAGIIRKLDGGSASSLCWARWIQGKRAFVFPNFQARDPAVSGKSAVEKILRGDFVPGDVIIVDVSGSELGFRKSGRRAR